ncbi:hypothetical protein BT67DRAFT_149366 [Trichocladium antarcticum]|uniref:Uncharacterized protein n=1 Tax=Trichocladium antarcticum TaxID=1450529 RepID=A0AAN6UEX0_9PEZI|nr:hypothetical protein BT67DRAFT_149366 [Trichocladium antarcticum]
MFYVELARRHEDAHHVCSIVDGQFWIPSSPRQCPSLAWNWSRFCHTHQQMQQTRRANLGASTPSEILHPHSCLLFIPAQLLLPFPRTRGPKAAASCKLPPADSLSKSVDEALRSWGINLIRRRGIPSHLLVRNATKARASCTGDHLQANGTGGQ